MKQTQKNFFQGVFTAVILVGGFLILGYEILAPSNALALSISNQFAQQMGYSTIPLDQQIVTIIQWALGFLALIAVIMIIYGGILWLTAAGNADRVERAKKVIMAAIIGIVILLLAWAIVWFVIQGVTEGGSGGPPGGQALQCVGNQCVMMNGGSGNCVDNSDCVGPGGNPSYITVTSLSPYDNEDEVSLCRSVQVKFSEAVVENNGNITLDKVAGGNVAGTITYTPNDIWMKFQPDNDLEPNTDFVANIPLTVVAQDGDSIDQQYTWQFKTGTTMDELPPQILQTSPADGATDVCLTPTFVVAFSEAMDVFTFKSENITINGPGNLTATRVDAMSDTVMTFTASGPMTANSNYTITLKSGPDGIADACGNPIDGNGNGTIDGTPADDYSWDFTTGSQADCKPEITNINPAFGLYEQAVTINGNNFTDIANMVVFNNNDEVDNRCFDANFYATNACIQSWNNTQIVVQVPAGGGNSNGAIDGGVKVLVGPQESNEKDFDVQSPHIRTMSPDDGADGRFVTLMGTDFGAAPGQVLFRKIGGNSFPGDQPTCDTWWTDTQIIVKVPVGFAVGDLLLVQVVRSDNRRSNLSPFEISTNTGPGVCDITPTCGGDGTDVTLTGDGFGTTGDLLFGTNTVTTTSWNATEVKATVTDAQVPDRAAPYPVRVRVGGKNSNAVSFDKPCAAGSDEHLACAALQCIPVSGAAPDECSGDPDCTGSGDTHTECSGTDCVVVAGAGGNQCSDGSCQNGSGASCDTDPSTPPPQCDAPNCTNPEVCRPSDCRCWIPPTYACSSDVWTCSPIDNCPGVQGCTENCECADRPVVIDRMPAAGAVDVCRNAVVQVTFNKPMMGSSFGNGAFVVYIGAGNNDDACAVPTDCRSGVCSAALKCVGDSVEGQLRFLSSSIVQYNMGLMLKNATHHVYLRDGPTGVKSTDGLTMAGPENYSFTTNNSDNPCQLTRVRITPGYRLFTQANETQAYIADGMYINQPITEIPGVYEWDWSWESDDVSIVTVTGSTTESETGTIDNKNGITLIKAKATVTTVPFQKEVVGQTKVEVALCEHPWPTAGAPYIDANTGFSTWYCLDGGLPALEEPPIESLGGAPDVIKSVFFRGLNLCEETKKDCSAYAGGPAVCGDPAKCKAYSLDAVGVRVMMNTDTKYSPKLWFEKNVPDQGGSTSPYGAVDGYQSMRVSRSTYIAATHLAGQLFANMYILSYSENAQSVTEEIAKAMLKNLRFNVGIDESTKDQYRRDMARMGALHDVREYTERFYEKNKYYPDLEVGSYLKNISTSAWPSWQATLGNALGKNLPVDPLNVFNIAACPAPPYEQETCWDEPDKKFTCQDPSNILLYKFNGPPPGTVQLYGSLENAAWATGAGNPCTGTSSCACFNYAETITPP